MRARSAAREATLQMLFAADLAAHDAETVLRDFWREFPGDPDDRKYADLALRGVLGARERIDERLREASRNWRLERMTTVARNVLRLGTWELLERSEIPRAVIIDEAVELAKRFDGQSSAAFVNGILDRVANDCGRVDLDRDPKPAAADAEPADALPADADATDEHATPPVNGDRTPETTDEE